MHTEVNGLKRSGVFCAGMWEQEFFTTLIQELSQASIYEWIAVIFGLLQVLLAWKNKVLLYPAGIISTVFSIYLLASVHLYAESFLNIYYFVMSIYGWGHWVRGKGKTEVRVAHTTRGEWIITVVIVVGGIALLYTVLRKFTPSDVPFWDACVSAFAWAGMWLLARRKLANWILLNISNAIAIPLQFHKGIPLYALLTIILFIVAIFGYWEWKKLARYQESDGFTSTAH